MKNLFLLLSLSLSTQFVFAQKFSFGLKGGANYHDWYFTDSKSSQLSGTSFDRNYFKPDFSGEFGVTAKKKLTKRLNLNGELLYAQRNVTYNNGLTRKNQYLAIPLFLSYNVFKSLSFDLGMEYSHLYKSTAFQYKELYSNMDFGSGIAGLRYDFLKNFNIHTRYVYTFNKKGEITWTDFNANVVGKSKIRFHTLSLAIGYNF